MRRKWVMAGAALAVLTVLLVAAAEINMGTTQADSLTSSGEAHVFGDGDARRRARYRRRA